MSLDIPAVPEYTPTVMDGAVLRWRWGYGNGSEVSASRNGVALDLPGVYQGAALEQIKALLDLALDAHRKIAAGGHDAAEAIVANLSRSSQQEQPGGGR